MVLLWWVNQNNPEQTIETNLGAMIKIIHISRKDSKRLIGQNLDLTKPFITRTTDSMEVGQETNTETEKYIIWVMSWALMMTN